MHTRGRGWLQAVMVMVVLLGLLDWHTSCSQGCSQWFCRSTNEKGCREGWGGEGASQQRAAGPREKWPTHMYTLKQSCCDSWLITESTCGCLTEPASKCLTCPSAKYNHRKLTGCCLKLPTSFLRASDGSVPLHNTTNFFPAPGFPHRPQTPIKIEQVVFTTLKLCTAPLRAFPAV